MSTFTIQNLFDGTTVNDTNGAASVTVDADSVSLLISRIDGASGFWNFVGQTSGLTIATGQGSGVIAFTTITGSAPAINNAVILNISVIFTDVNVTPNTNTILRLSVRALRLPSMSSSQAILAVTAGKPVAIVLSASPLSSTHPPAWQCDYLPSGLTLNSTTGIITGTAPTVPGIYQFTFSAENEIGRSYQPFLLTVTADSSADASAAVPVIDTIYPGSTVSNGEVTFAVSTGASVNTQLSATEFPTSWSAANLPSGFSLGEDGTLSGTAPTIAGHYRFSVTASNANGASTPQTFGLAVTAPDPATAQSNPSALYLPWLHSNWSLRDLQWDLAANIVQSYRASGAAGALVLKSQSNVTFAAVLKAADGTLVASGVSSVQLFIRAASRAQEDGLFGAGPGTQVSLSGNTVYQIAAVLTGPIIDNWMEDLSDAASSATASQTVTAPAGGIAGDIGLSCIAELEAVINGATIRSQSFPIILVDSVTSE